MNVDRLLRYLCTIVVFGLIWTLLAQGAAAATYTWDDGANSASGPTDGSGTWATTSNWWNGSGFQVWNNATDDTAQFGFRSGDSTAYNVTLSPSTTAGGIIFQDQAYTLSGNTLTLAGVTPTITVNAASATVNSVIAGSAGLVTSGTGLITLTGANTYTGGTTINSGTLQLNAATSAGPGSQTITLGDAGTGANNTQLNLNVATVANSVVISGQGSGAAKINYVPNTGGNFTLSLGSISMNGPATITFPSITSLVFFNSVLSGSGQLTIGATDSQRCLMNGSASPLYTGNIAVQSGAIFEPRSMLTTANGNNITVNSGGELRIQFSTTSIAGLNGAGTVDSVSGAATLSVGEGNASGSTFSGTMKNNGSTLSFAKTGTGTQTLSGANIIYTGGTSLNQGTLNLTNATGFASTVTMSNASTLDLQLGSTGSSTWTFGRTINGGSTNAVIQAVGPGTVVLNPASGSSFIGSSSAALTVTAGNLTLASSFNTAPAVSVGPGAAFVDNSPGSLTTGAVSLAGGATLSGTGSVGATTVAAGGGIIGGYNGAGQLTLASLIYSGTGTMQAPLGATTPIVVSGAVTTGGSGSIAVTAANLPANGTYNLLSYGSGADPFSAFALNPPTRTLSLLDDSGSNLIQIVVNQSVYPIWTGLASGDWSLATEPGAKNWRLNTGGTTDFLTADTVVFDDSVGTAGTTNVAINNGNVSPGSVTFNNNLYNYTLSGSNGIATGSLTLNGSGAVTINTANTFGGGTTLNAGTLSVGNNAALGSGTLGINGGWLQATGGAITLSNNVTANATLQVYTNANSLTLNGTVTGGNLYKTGTGMLTLGSANNNFSGNLTVSQGTLQVGSVGAGSGTISLGDANTGASNPQLNINTVSSITNPITVGNPASNPTTINVFGNIGTFNSAVTVNSPLTIVGNGAPSTPAPTFSLAGSGTVTFSVPTANEFIPTGNASSFTGNVVIAAPTNFEPRGFLSSANGNNVTVQSGGTLQLISFGATTINALNGNGTVQDRNSVGALTVGIGNGSGTFSGTMQNYQAAWTLTKTGTGTEELSGGNIAYTGATTLTQGTLRLTNAAAFASTITMDPSNTVDLQLNATSGTAWTFGQQINGGSTNAIIEKIGPGTVVLNPASGGTFSGSSTAALTVTAGGLYLTNTNLNYFGAPAVSVGSAGIFGGNTTVGAAAVAAGGGIVGGYSGAGQLTLASLTYSGTGTAAGVLSAGTPPIVVNGSVTANPASIAVSPTNLPADGTYPFLSYTGTDPFSDFTLSSSVIGRTVLTLVDSSASDLIALTLTTSAYPIWTGRYSGDWSLATESSPKNWKVNAGGATDFLAGDKAVFDDSVGTAGTTNVTLNNGNVNPGSVTFNNNLYNYTLSGTAGITTGSLTLNGSAAVTINTANSFGGGTTLNAGTLIVGNNAALGSGGVLINGGWLQPAGGPIALSNPVTASGNFAIGANTNSLTLNGAVNLNPTSGTSTISVNGTGVVFANAVTGNNLVTSGAGMLTLSASNSFSGAVTVSQGTLQLNNAAAAGTAPITLGDGNSGSANMQLSINDPGVANAITVSGSGSGMATIAYLPAVGSTGYSSAAQSITVNGATTFTASNLTGYLLFNPSLSGSGGLAIGTTNNQRLIVQTDQSAFTGNVEVQSGAVFEPRGYFDSPNGNNITVDAGGTMNLWFSPLVMNGLNGSGIVSTNYSGGGPLTVGAGNGSGVFSGSFVVGGNGSPSPGLIKTGTGTQELSGAGINYTFPTTLTQGTLRLTNATGWASPITMDYYNTVDLQLNATSGTAWTFSQQINGGSSNSIIEKVGSGTVVLAPASGSTFQGSGTGALTVTAGALYLTNSNLSSYAPPPVSVASGGIFGGNTTVAAATVAAGGGIVGGYSGAGQLTLASLTYSGTGTAAGVLSAGTPPIVVNGSVTANPASIAVSPTNLPADGTYPFLSYTGSDPFSDFTLSTPIIGRTVLSLVDSADSDLIALTLTTSAYPIWTGKASGDWSLNTEPNPKNWRLNTGGTTDFLTNDKVVFDDSVGTAGTTNVTLNNGNVNPGSVTFNNNLYNYTLSGTAGITTGSLTLNGSAAVTINTANSFGGGTTLNAGTLIVSNNSAIGSGGLLINGGWLQPAGGPIALPNNVTANADFAIGAGTNSLTLNGTVNLYPTSGTSTITVNGTGGVVFGNVVTGNYLVKSGMGLLDLAAANIFAGGVTVSQGTLQLDNAGAGTAPITLGDANTGGNNLQLTVNSSSAANNITVANQGTGTATISLMASTAVTNWGSNSNTIALCRATTLTTPVETSYLQFNQALSGSGELDIGGTNAAQGGWIILFNQSPSFTGNVVIGNNAVLEPRDILSSPNGNNVTVQSGGTLQLISFGATEIAGLSGSGDVRCRYAGTTLTVGEGDASSTFSGTLQNGQASWQLIKTGAGTFTLAGANTFSGGTFVDDGVLQLGNPSALGTGPVAADGGILDLAGYSVSVPSFSGAAGVVTNSASGTVATLNINQANSAVFGGSISNGAGRVALSLEGGMLALTGSNGYSGGTTVYSDSGTAAPPVLQMGANNALPYGPGMGNVTVSGSGLLDLAGFTTNVNGLSGNGTVDTTLGSGTLVVGNGDASSVFSGVLQNSNSDYGYFLALTKVGSGTLILSGANSDLGGTTVEEGTLILASPTALADGTSLTVGQGASALFAPAGTMYSWSAGPVTSAAAQVAAVPEPGSLALLLAALAASLGVWQVLRIVNPRENTNGKQAN